MPEEQNRIRQIAWLELFPWLALVRAVRLAFAPRMLVLGAIGLAATIAGWGAIGSMFSGSADPTLKKVRGAIEPWPELMATDLAPDGPLPPVSISVLDPAKSPAQEPWKALSNPFQYLFEWDVSVASFTYLLLCGFWALLVWALFGAAITRAAALWFAREDRLGFRRALLWGVMKWPAYVGGPLFTLAGVLIAVIPIAILCVLLKLDVGVLLVGVIWPLVLLCGLFVAILLVGLLFGWPLMWPTVSAEGTDSFDALSRSYSYTYQRPVHYLFYAAIAGILGTLAWVVVLIFARGVINYSYWAASWGSGGARIQQIRELAEPAMPWQNITVPTTTIPPSAPTAPTDVSWSLWAGSRAIGFWVRVVKTLALGFLFSYFWCAATYIYFLLRQSVDATEMDEVAVEDEPEQFGLPPLQTAPGAPPQVVEPPPTAAD